MENFPNINYINHWAELWGSSWEIIHKHNRKLRGSLPSGRIQNLRWLGQFLITFIWVVSGLLAPEIHDVLFLTSSFLCRLFFVISYSSECYSIIGFSSTDLSILMTSSQVQKQNCMILLSCLFLGFNRSWRP